MSNVLMIAAYTLGLSNWTDLDSLRGVAGGAAGKDVGSVSHPLFNT